MPDQPSRVQLSRRKGWRMPPNTVKVDRSTMWGNPWRVGEHGVGTAAEAVRLFRVRLPGGMLSAQPHPESRMGKIANGLDQLRGKNLACWCKLGDPCHADVLLELANA